MSTDLDEELLRRRLAALADGPRSSLDHVERDVGRRVSRRRRRATRGGTAVGTVVLALVGAVLVAAPGEGPDTVTSGHADGGPVPGDALVAAPVAIEAIEPEDGPTGTERLVVTFDSPLPLGQPTFEAGALPDGPTSDHIVVTTQSPQRVWVCESWHSFPTGVGTVDVLVPAAWLPEGFDLDDVRWPERTLLRKVVACGPHQGFIQISIWGPSSTDPTDITAQIGPDRHQLTIELAPP